jgi:hypothetical protein
MPLLEEGDLDYGASLVGVFVIQELVCLTFYNLVVVFEEHAL